MIEADGGGLGNEGEGRGSIAGVFEEEGPLVVGGGTIKSVLRGVRLGRAKLVADSGSSRFSITSSISWSPDLAATALLPGELSFIRSEAGVAGDGTLWRGLKLGVLTFSLCGAMYGDGRADRDAGIGGGGISADTVSFRVSGETDPFSESVAP